MELLFDIFLTIIVAVFFVGMTLFAYLIPGKIETIGRGREVSRRRKVLKSTLARKANLRRIHEAKTQNG